VDVRRVLDRGRDWREAEAQQQTIRNMIDRGELAAVRIGKRRVRVRQSELDAFIEAGEVRPVDPPEARQAFHEALRGGSRSRERRRPCNGAPFAV
jgi:excisionase family DNA binding protein